jgi:hypothetical protein
MFYKQAYKKNKFNLRPFLLKKDKANKGISLMYVRINKKFVDSVWYA